MANMDISQGQFNRQIQSQNLAMSPQQIHAIKLLQMNSIELMDEIRNELIENPVLEIDDFYDSNKADETPEDWNDNLNGT